MRHELLQRSSFISTSSLQPENQAKRRSSPGLLANTSGNMIEQYDLYEITDSPSDIRTVVNTSILPYSYEPTEREFSPFTMSPLLTPRRAAPETGMAMSFLIPGPNHNKNKKMLEVKIPEYVKNPEIPSAGNSKEIDLSFFTLNRSNYLPRHLGDEVLSPPGMFSSPQSRQDTRSPL